MSAKIAPFGNLVAVVSRVAVLLGALWFTLAFLVVAANRLGAPFDLEWMEGLVIDGGVLFSLGRSIYDPPNSDFMPPVYAPGYSLLIAILFKIFGASYLVARMVSAISTLVITGMLFVIVRTETRSNYWGIVAAGLFLAAYRFTGAWYDLARVDMLAFALVAVAAWVALRGRSLWAAGLAGLLLAAAILTKQSTAFFLPAFPALYAARGRAWPSALAFLGAGAGLTSLSLLLLHVMTNGWSTYYIVELPLRQPRLEELSRLFWEKDILGGMPFLLLAIALLTFTVLAKRKTQLDSSFIFVFALALTGIIASWLTRSRLGGYDNVLISAIMPTVLLIGLGVGALEADRVKPWPRFLPYVQAVFNVLLIGQMALWAYPPTEQVPASGDYLADKRLRHYLVTLNGNIYSPQRGFLTRGAEGRPTSTHLYSVIDALLDPNHKVGFPEELARRLATGYYRFVLLDPRWQWELEEYLTCYYVTSPEHSIHIHSPPTRTGLELQVDTLLVYIGPQQKGC